MDDLDFDAKTRYIAKYSGETVVIKCGGETLESPQALDHVLSQIVMLADAGVHVLMVHGGGARPGAVMVSVEDSSQFASALLLSSHAGGWQVATPRALRQSIPALPG